jgi:hypothetical protein
LEKAYIFEKAIGPDWCNQLMAKLQERLVVARVALQNCQVEELDLGSALNLIEKILANAATLDAQLTSEPRRRLLAVLSPGGFRYDEKKGIKIVTSACIFNVLSSTPTPALRGGVTDGI